MQLQNKTVLVTGGAGFIGSHLVEELVFQGANVRVLDNLSTGNYANLVQAGCANKIDFIQGDIRDPEMVMKVVRGCDYVLHHAAKISVPEGEREPMEYVEVNVRGTEIVLRCAEYFGVKRLVLASSCAVEGDSVYGTTKR